MNDLYQKGRRRRKMRKKRRTEKQSLKGRLESISYSVILEEAFGFKISYVKIFLYSSIVLFCVCVLCQGLILSLFFILDQKTRNEYDSSIHACPVDGCSHHRNLRRIRNFTEENIRENGEVKFSREINVCGFVLNHLVRKERDVTMTFYVEDTKINYLLTYIYSMNDEYPKTRVRESEFLIYPEYTYYSSILKKVWFALRYIYFEKGANFCDFVMKMDDDVHLDYLTLSYILISSSPDDWIGRFAPDLGINMFKSSKWYDPSYYDYIEGVQDKYFPFMAGQMYVLGKHLFQCMVRDGVKKVKREFREIRESSYFSLRYWKWFLGYGKPIWLDLKNEDVAVGLLAVNCLEKNVRNFSESYFGEYAKSMNDITWVGYLVIHKNVRQRKGYEQIHETIFSPKGREYER